MLRSASLTHVSLTLVGLMWVLPFLNYNHQYPITTFYQEWSSALLGVLAITLLVTSDYWQRPEIPRIAQLPIALMGVVLLQAGLGMFPYYEQAMLYVLYLLFAALLMLVGARLRKCMGMTKLAQMLAIFLLIGGELSALIGVLQHYRWDTPLNSVVVMKTYPGVYGNIAQTNHYANYIALGMVSLGLLFRERKLRAYQTALLAMPLLLVMTLSGSRSSWLYLVMMAGLAWWWASRDAGQKPLLRYCLLLIGGFSIMHLIVQLPFMAPNVESSVNTIQRLLGDNLSGGVRGYYWREATMMFMESPGLGVGFGQFAWHHFQLLPVLQPTLGFAGVTNNSHNLIFQLAAEAGVAGLLALSLSLGAWVLGLHKKYAIFTRKTFAPVPDRASMQDNPPPRSPLDAAHWWGFAALGVLGIHSLLEYPLWYTYFIAIAAILLGALDETSYQLELRKTGRASVAIILILGLIMLMQLRGNYRDLEQVLALRASTHVDQDVVDQLRGKLLALHEGSLLSPYSGLFMSSLIEVNDDHLKEKLAYNARVMHFAPVDSVVYLQAFLLAQSGQVNEAKTMLSRAIWSFPYEYKQPRQQLLNFAVKNPERFSALLEFALQKEQEYPLEIYYR